MATKTLSWFPESISSTLKIWASCLDYVATSVASDLDVRLHLTIIIVGEYNEVVDRHGLGRLFLGVRWLLWLSGLIGVFFLLFLRDILETHCEEFTVTLQCESGKLINFI